MYLWLGAYFGESDQPRESRLGGLFTNSDVVMAGACVGNRPLLEQLLTERFCPSQHTIYSVLKLRIIFNDFFNGTKLDCADDTPSVGTHAGYVRRDFFRIFVPVA